MIKRIGYSGWICLVTCTHIALMAGCMAPRPAVVASHDDVWKSIFSEKNPALDKVLSNPAEYQVQIIYTRIDRDKSNHPHFTSYYYDVDSTRYFYPASTVKMPLAFLAAERMGHWRRTYPRLRLDTPYRLDSLRKIQIAVRTDSSAANFLPSVAHDIKKIFLVSDNFSYNNLFDLLGREYINQTLREKGYSRTGILHRFYLPGVDNRYSRPVTFTYKGKDVLFLPERFDTTAYRNPQSPLLQGIGFMDSEDQLVEHPFDFSGRNWTSLQDLHDMLKAVMFPKAVPASERFDLTKADYHFLYRWMSAFPRESTHPRYDPSEYPDGYAKFLLYGGQEQECPGHIRIFNKIGQAYGYLTDIAYIVDFKNQVECMIAATIRCNEDGIYNDDHYSYDEVGFPFLQALGQAVCRYEYNRERPIKPDLSDLEAIACPSDGDND